MKNRFITCSPEDLHLPLLDLPRVVVLVSHKFYRVQGSRRIRKVLQIERIFRSNMIRESMSGYGCRVRALLQLNADVAGNVRSDHEEHSLKELIDRGPTLGIERASCDSHAVVLQAC